MFHPLSHTLLGTIAIAVASTPSPFPPQGAMVGAEFFLGEGRHGEGEEQEEGFHSLSQHRKHTYTHKKTHAHTRARTRAKT